MSLSEPSYYGYLEFEEVPGSDAFVRRFFVLNRTNARLEYYADDNIWVVLFDNLNLNIFLFSYS